jgi:hypothetical protein
MKKPRKIQSVRVQVSAALLLEVRRLSPRTSVDKLLSQLLINALEDWVDERREKKIDQDVIKMGKDPHILAECRKINREFAVTDSDGLKGL